MYFDKSTKIYVAGHRGLVGSAICRELTNQGYENIIIRSDNEIRNIYNECELFSKIVS